MFDIFIRIFNLVFLFPADLNKITSVWSALNRLWHVTVNEYWVSGQEEEKKDSIMNSQRLPSLPGLSLEVRFRKNHHVPQSFYYQNGYRIDRKPAVAIGKEPLEETYKEFYSEPIEWVVGNDDNDSCLYGYRNILFHQIILQLWSIVDLWAHEKATSSTISTAFCDLWQEDIKIHGLLSPTRSWLSYRALPRAICQYFLFLGGWHSGSYWAVCKGNVCDIWLIYF